MNSSRYKLIEQHIDSFPVLPATVSRVLEVTNDPECSAQDLMEAVMPDQSLSLTILKIANSVLFGRPKRVESIKMAITILGFNEVANIALSKALFNSFNDLPKQHQPFLDGFWQHSFFCGMAARKIAVDLDYARDIAFMAGLIHDVGKLVMLQTFADEHTPPVWLLRHSIEEMLEEERQLYSFTHDEIGGQLLSKWHFPDTLITAVASHHHPESAEQEYTYAYIVQLADIIAFYSCNPQMIEDEIVSTILGVLPELPKTWRKRNLPFQYDAITDWFNWLEENKEQGEHLKSVFSV